MKEKSNSIVLTQVFSLFQSWLARYYGHDQKAKKSRSSSSIQVSTGRDFIRQAGTKGEIANHDKHAKPDRGSITSST